MVEPSWHPLPSNYGDMPPAEQSLARVEAVSRYETPEVFAESWALYRNLYLLTLPKGAFYRKGVVESPPAHYEWIQDFARYPRNVLASPRGSAKSTIIGRELPLMLATTRPYTVTTLFLANDAMVEERINELMQQLNNNEHLRRDFGNLKPRRGENIWNRHHLSLGNGSIIQGVSIDSRKLGKRPNYLILDDPEYYPEIEGNDTQFFKKMEQLLFDELLPMLDTPEDRFFWIGTLLSRRSGLWYACMGDDPRFRLWNRRVYATVHYTDQGRATYFWGKRWGPEYVQRRRRELGPIAFEAQCQNNPTSRSARTLRIHEDFNTYRVVENTISWRARNPRGAAEVFEWDYDTWLCGLSRIITVEPAATVSPTSDYSAMLCAGIDKLKVWWILDLFLGRIDDTALVEHLYEMGNKWQPPVVGVESINFQETIKNRIEVSLQDRQAGKMWQPRVYPIRYPGKYSKAARIEAVLAPRLARHQIRLPEHLKDHWPFNQMWSQIEDFTPDLKLLPHDDVIDALTMVQYCPRVSPTSMDRWQQDDSIEAQLLAGRTTEKHSGIPLAMYIDPTIANPAIIEAIRKRRSKQVEAAKGKTDDRSAQAVFKRLGSPLAREPRIMKRVPRDTSPPRR